MKIELIFGAGQGPVHKLSNLFYNERQKLKGVRLVFITVRVFTIVFSDCFFDHFPGLAGDTG